MWVTNIEKIILQSCVWGWLIKTLSYFFSYLGEKVIATRSSLNMKKKKKNEGTGLAEFPPVYHPSLRPCPVPFFSYTFPLFIKLSIKPTQLNYSRGSSFPYEGSCVT